MKFLEFVAMQRKSSNANPVDLEKFKKTAILAIARFDTDENELFAIISKRNMRY